MTLTRTVTRALAVGLGAVAVAATLPAGPAHSDTLCTSTGGRVYDWPSYNASVVYGIAPGGAFQWTGFVSGEFLQGSYPGLRTGFMPRANLQC